MRIFRYIFLLAIVSGCTSVGFLISKGYYERVKELNVLSKLINILQNKIKFTHKPLGEIFEEISIIKENEKISEIFAKTNMKLKEEKIEDAWSESVKSQSFYLNLKSEDIAVISTLGNVLGKSDIEGQMSEINQFNILLNGQIKKAEEERTKNSKMYKSLGCIVGLAIVILLY